MKNILLATDISPESDRALERAIHLAAMLSARLHIVHVCPAHCFSARSRPADLLRQSAEEALADCLAGFRALNTLQSTVKVIEGREIFLEIIQYAEKVKAGLIVMGMHGKASLMDMFVGTTVERVIRKGVRPVLMVRNKPRGSYENVLAGTDFSAGSRQALNVALELAPSSHFHLVHSYEIPDTYIGDKITQYAGDVVEKYAEDRLEGFVKENRRVLRKFGVAPDRFRSRVVKGAAFPSLMNAAAAVKADLLALGTHSRASLMPYKLGGTAHDILNNPPCDVLVARGL